MKGSVFRNFPRANRHVRFLKYNLFLNDNKNTNWQGVIIIKLRELFTRYLHSPLTSREIGTSSKGEPATKLYRDSPPLGVRGGWKGLTKWHSPSVTLNYLNYLNYPNYLIPKLPFSYTHLTHNFWVIFAKSYTHLTFFARYFIAQSPKNHQTVPVKI